VTVHVYGRSEYAEPLVHVGVVGEVRRARETYPGNWVELVAFPEQSIHWIIRDGRTVDDAG
jgi:hypothetical protein